MHKYLKKIRKYILTTIMCTSLLSTSTALALPEYFPLEEVHKGIKGTGYTVIEQSGEILPFDVEVEGIIGGGKLNSPRILVRVSGPLMEKTGGTLSGMSGSPVYFEGKLAGALSASFVNMELNTALLTPIEEMLPIWEYPDRYQRLVPEGKSLKELQEGQAKEREAWEKKLEAIEKKIAISRGEVLPEVKPHTEEKAEEPAEKASEGALGQSSDYVSATDREIIPNEESDGAEGVEEAMVAYGFNSAGRAFLAQKLKPLGIKIKNTYGNISGASAATIQKDVSLRPGDPVGVYISVGDFSLGSIGTVTTVEDQKILAYGHSFYRSGNVDFFMVGSQVVGTAHGISSGMKIANPVSIIGRINQDRENGVAGILGEFPQTVPVLITIKDKDTGKTNTYSSMIAYNEKILSAVATAMVYNSMSKAMDRGAGNTADIKFSLRTDAISSGILERRNMFYDSVDIGQVSLGELSTMLDIIATNKEKEAKILDLKVDITLDSNRCTASLVSAVPDKQKALPGEKITFDVTLKPYRGKEVVVKVPYVVPAYQQPGVLNLDIHGGGFINMAKLLLNQQNQGEANGQEEVLVSTENRLQEMAAANCNNDIVIETTVNVPQTDKELKDAIKKAKELSDKLKRGEALPPVGGKEEISRQGTDYVIDNVIHASILVEKEK